MKKLLLTSLAAFCLVGLAAAQEPAKVAKKKAALKSQSTILVNSDYTAKVKAKEAKAAAIESGKTVAPAAQNAKASRALAAEKAN